MTASWSETTVFCWGGAVSLNSRTVLPFHSTDMAYQKFKMAPAAMVNFTQGSYARTVWCEMASYLFVTNLVSKNSNSA